MILAKILTPRLVISAALCGLSIIAIVALSVTGFVVDPLSGSVDFVGPFASKNQLAFFVALLWLTGFTVLIDGRQPGIFRTLGALCFLASGPLIILARSATSDLTAGASLLALIANLGFSRLNVRARARGIFAVTIISLPAIFLLASLEGDLQANVLALLGKDQTLTGRTILWQRAFELIPEHPWLGQGFKAFWREGYVEAESLWAMFGVRGGFHFHDTLIETTIEIGYVGAALLLIFVGLVTFCVLAWSWQKKSIESSYFVAILFLLLVRSIVEVDVPSEFSLATFVLVMAAQYGFSERAGSRFALAKGAHALELQNVLARQRQEHRA
jgi:exopolysaccharide production protein ExoQ